MALYKAYPAHIILLRRAFAVVAGVAALPVMLFWKDRARYYSWLHRCGRNQRAAGVDGAGGESRSRFLLILLLRRKYKTAGLPRRFFAACLHSFYAPP